MTSTSNIPPPDQVSGLIAAGNHRRLEEMVDRSQRVLMCIKSIFPFDFFPDVLTIDENKVTLICHELGYENVHGVFIENISYVTVDTDILHATLNVTDSTSERFPKILSIHHLKKEDAFKARSLIEGLIAAKKLNVDFAIFKTEELVNQLVKLGEAKEAR